MTPHELANLCSIPFRMAKDLLGSEFEIREFSVPIRTPLPHEGDEAYGIFERILYYSILPDERGRKAISVGWARTTGEKIPVLRMNEFFPKEIAIRTIVEVPLASVSRIVIVASNGATIVWLKINNHVWRDDITPPSRRTPAD